MTRLLNLHIFGMQCRHCTSIIKNLLISEPGVVDVEVKLDYNSAEITYDDMQTNEYKLESAVNNSGIYNALVF